MNNPMAGVDPSGYKIACAGGSSSGGCGKTIFANSGDSLADLLGQGNGHTPGGNGNGIQPLTIGIPISSIGSPVSRFGFDADEEGDEGESVSGVVSAGGTEFVFLLNKNAVEINSKDLSSAVDHRGSKGVQLIQQQKDRDVIAKAIKLAFDFV